MIMYFKSVWELQLSLLDCYGSHSSVPHFFKEKAATLFFPISLCDSKLHLTFHQRGWVSGGVGGIVSLALKDH